MGETKDHNERYKKFNLLYEKSLRLIQEQYDSYKITHGKTSTLISLSAFIFPLILTLSNFKDYEISLIYLLSIPLTTYFVALILFCIILFPRDLKYGYLFNKIEEQFNQDSINYLKGEIMALKLAFEANAEVIKNQNRKFILAIILTMFSVSFLCIIVFIGHLEKSGKETSNKIKIETIEKFNNFN